MPTYLGAGHVRACLESLAEQTLPREEFEVVVVLNGPADGTRDVVTAVREAHSGLDVRLLQVSGSGAGHARNVGLEAARNDYVTFVDDDDGVGPDFLRALRDAAAPGVLVAAPVHEVVSGSSERRVARYIARRLEQSAGRTLPLAEVAVVCEYNAAKLVDVGTARSARYDESLRSGEDLVYWLEVFAASKVAVRVLPDDVRTAYVRTVRQGGVGRQERAFDFQVTQRLECLAAVAGVDGSDPEVREVADRLRLAQARWINQFLREQPHERDRVVAEASRLGLKDVPWHVVNAGLARALAVLYCFPPDLDTSAVVAAKRLGLAGEVTDVVSADLSSIRSVDERGLRLVGPALGRHHVVRGRPSYHQWSRVRHFAERTWERVERWESGEQPASYERLYSRAMAVGAHYGAALVKVRRPGLSWTAEFSDPLRFNPLGEERPPKLGNDEISRELLAALAGAGFDVPEQPRLFDVAERLAYALADRVVFTNEHQRDYMLGYCEDPDLVRRVRARSEVCTHPVPAPELYDVGQASLRLDGDQVHLAYFGVFYATRDLSVLLEALARLGSRERRRVVLHVFTPEPRPLMVQAIALGLADVVRARPYVGYFDFLALTRRFDVLVVNDAATSDHHRLNPYLPSKVADYAGSGTPVWAIYEPDSVLSTMPFEHRSPLGDVEGAIQVLRQLLDGASHPPGKPRVTTTSVLHPP